MTAIHSIGQALALILIVALGTIALAAYGAAKLADWLERKITAILRGE